MNRKNVNSDKTFTDCSEYKQDVKSEEQSRTKSDKNCQALV